MTGEIDDSDRNMSPAMSGEERVLEKSSYGDGISRISDSLQITDEVAELLAQIYARVLSDAWGKSSEEDQGIASDDDQETEGKN